MKKTNNNRQRGFTLVELLVVLGIMAVLSIFAVPYASGVITSGKVTPIASDINKTVAKVRANFAGSTDKPYASIATGVFANTARGLVTSLTPASSGASATMTHDIGAAGSYIQAAPYLSGAQFTVTVPTVNEAACPDLASQLSKAAIAIKINTIDAKLSGGLYNAAIAKNACKLGDNNDFVFYFD